MAVGFVVLPAAIGFWPWLSEARPPGCEAPDWCLSSREKGFLAAYLWLWVVPFALAATFLLLLSVRWATLRSSNPPPPISRILGVLRVAVLLVPAAWVFIWVT